MHSNLKLSFKPFSPNHVKLSNEKFEEVKKSYKVFGLSWRETTSNIKQEASRSEYKNEKLAQALQNTNEITPEQFILFDMHRKPVRRNQYIIIPNGTHITYKIVEDGLSENDSRIVLYDRDQIAVPMNKYILTKATETYTYDEAKDLIAKKSRKTFVVSADSDVAYQIEADSQPGENFLRDILEGNDSDLSDDEGVEDIADEVLDRGNDV